MDGEWVKSTAARRILVHWADARPAWLWSADGNTLIWRNNAARYFNAKIKKYGLKLAPEPVPIKGQVARLIRLGSAGRSSLSRIQFLAGGRPASTTATVTPIELANGEMAGLIVAVDPVEPEVLAEPVVPASPTAASLLPPAAAYLLLDPEGRIVDSSSGAADRFGELASAPAETIEHHGERLTLTRYKASPQGHQLLLIEGASAVPMTIAEIRAEEGLAVLEPAAPDAAAPAEPMLPMGLPPVEVTEEVHATVAPPEPNEPPSNVRLSSLFDRLADNDALYTELTDADEHFEPPTPPVTAEPAREPEPPVEVPPATAPEPEAVPETVPASDPPVMQPGEPDVIAAVIEFEDDLQDHPQPAVTYRVTGRGFMPLDQTAEAATEPVAPPRDPEMVERASRYNFDELSRILSDRVGSETPAVDGPVEIDPPIEPLRPPVPPAVSEGALINIAAETFVLNRLPLGIMVFRDQQVLFANRALTDLVGYSGVDQLRNAGLTAIFPSDDAAVAGPVTHLVRRDGMQMPVTARLQSITWQGRPALMLSASSAETRIGHEAAVRSFAELAAALSDEGFMLADRAGIVTMMSAPARLALGRREEDAVGDPILSLIHPDDAADLREFLERPARFAETARPSVMLRGKLAGTTLLLFAEGQAGVVTGYFGFVRQAAPAAKPAEKAPAGDDEVDPSMLARVSRGVRRPLNTIIGFADLIRSAAFGTIENHRYLEYARDIKTAGQEIAVLVDELDDYARLKSGKFAVRTAELDLAALLESCVVRVRGQAGAARVLVRSAISERLPHVHADRASLGQAVLNLLASAIDQTPTGGSVILSAHLEDNGSIVINVRDSGAPTVDPGERFVVFRDGVGKDGEALAPVRSSVGLALTRSLIAVNACSLSVDPAGAVGTLFSLVIPADLVAPGAP